MNKPIIQSDIQKMIESNKESLGRNASFLGQNVDDVLDKLGVAPAADCEKTFAESVSQLGADGSLQPPGPVQADTTVYAGSASLYGAVRGTCNAGVYFGDQGNFNFAGSMWTSPIVAGGGGAGAWSTVPTNNQEMGFAWWGASVEGGSVNILWNINGVIVGSMAILVAGIGGGGGSGSGKWTKGN